jgi:large subunit ribosomal protein L34e
MAPRVTYRKHNSYNTRSNRIRKVKTPGGRVVAQYPNKSTEAVRCAEVHWSL